MRRAAILALAASAALGCSKREERTADAAAYASPHGAFSCSAPAAWRVLERNEGAPTTEFFGPPDGRKPFSASVRVTLYPLARFSSARDYHTAQLAAGAKVGPERRERAKAGAGLSFEARRVWPGLHGAPGQTVLERHVALDTPRGVLAVVSSAAPQTAAEAAAAQALVLETLELK